MARRKQRPARRQPPTTIEIAARDYVPKRRVMLDSLPDEALELAEEILDDVASIQLRWTADVEFLRSQGVTTIPSGQTVESVAKQLRSTTAYQIPLIRVLSCDRQKFRVLSFVRTLRQARLG